METNVTNVLILDTDAISFIQIWENRLQIVTSFVREQL